MASIMLKRKAAAVLLALLAAAFQTVSNYITAKSTSSIAKSRKRALEADSMPTMKNLFSFRFKAQTPLPYRSRFGQLMQDPGRNYSKKLTHMFSWEIVDLAQLCKTRIEAPRQTSWRPKPKPNNPYKGGRPPKLDYIDRLVLTLEWLSSANTGDKLEFDSNYCKSSIMEDHKHVLKAIDGALHDQIKWPNADERQEHYSTYNGIFDHCVGIFDVTEWTIRKSKVAYIENHTFSGKAKENTMKTLAVINKYGYFIWIDQLVFGRRNDRDQYTSTDLYMNGGKYFSQGEKLASDGGFKGDGNLIISYDNLDSEDKKTYNLAFKEVRVGVENAFGRVQMWFPIFGHASRYWVYDLETLELATRVAMKLHNWLLRHRDIDYNAENSPRNFYRHLW
jgi:hypothetical protein